VSRDPWVSLDQLAREARPANLGPWEELDLRVCKVLLDLKV